MQHCTESRNYVAEMGYVDFMLLERSVDCGEGHGELRMVKIKEVLLSTLCLKCSPQQVV